MPAFKHVHKYIRKSYGKKYIYKCDLPDCTHFIIMLPLMEGRKCICNRCGLPFIITKETLKKCPAKPHCNACYGATNMDKKVDEALDELLEGI